MTPKEVERLVDERRGALTRSAYVRWVLTRAADTLPHGSEGSMIMDFEVDEVPDGPGEG